MTEREFDGQLAVAPTQSALLQAVQEKLATLTAGLNAQAGGVDPPRGPQAPARQRESGIAPYRPNWQLP